MYKNLLSTVCFVLAVLIGQAQNVGGITATCLASHIYNNCGTTGYITFGFTPTTNANTSTPDPLTIQQSSLSVGINTNAPLAKLHIKGSGTGTTSSSMLVNNSAGTELFRILDNGNIGIGIAAPQTALAVAGTITTKKVKVSQTGWPDFVFSPGYQLPDLTQLERYILLHKHLPGISSATEVEKDGVDLGDNQAAMLQKVEELTLYVIQQKKEIDTLKEENKKRLSLQSQLDEVKKQLQLMSAQSGKH